MNAPTRLESMTPRELGAGLMRGNRRELKTGYSWENAHEAVLRLRALDAEQSTGLQLYLRGFAFGMADREPEAAYMDADALPYGNAYGEGWEDGRNEPPALILPALAEQD